jgi:hypothetical protein
MNENNEFNWSDIVVTYNSNISKVRPDMVFVCKGLQVRRNLSEKAFGISTATISDKSMFELTKELYYILSNCFYEWTESDVQEYIICTPDTYNERFNQIDQEKVRLTRELLLEYGAIPV